MTTASSRLRARRVAFRCAAPRVTVAILGLAVASAWAQLLPPPPDAGRILRELTPPPAFPQRDASPLRIEPPAAAPSTAPGGATVALREVVIEGATLFDAATLSAAVGEVAGRSFDVAALESLAARLAAFYRERGHPFVRTFLPEQSLADGVLRIAVIEGRWGRIQPGGEPWMVEGARPFAAPLRRGELIDTRALERVVLLIEDQPGIRVVPVLRPGEARGEGDLALGIERESLARGEVGVDNAGNRWSGTYRAFGTLSFDSPFSFGDRLVLRGLVSNERLWLGGVDYDRPIGGDGLRAQVGVARTSYVLGGPYRALGANGIADVMTLRATYPIVRTQRANLFVSAGVQGKRLEDRADAVDSVRDKRSVAVPLGLQFDARDDLAGGGTTWGLLSATVGRLDLDAATEAIDAATARTAGGFSRINLDVSRLQRLPGPFAASARLALQWTADNLDSSEGFALGGPYGVRGYPPGEALGARGALVQAELRWLAGPATPYALLDLGRTTANPSPWDSASDVTRTLGAAGVGLRGGSAGWSFDASLAWRTRGGAPTSDTHDHVPRLFATASYRF
jgi:hemolysin activation/secretion protein